MADSEKPLSPPYGAYGSFTGFLNSLRETSIPARIDKSVFGNASGSVIYSTLKALRALRLIADDGTPTEEFKELVNASDDVRKPLLRDLLKRGYPVLFSGAIDLQSASAAQFDEVIRTEYDVNGSTIDKIAAFFIAAATDAGLELSPHLKRRRPIAASSSSRKNSKQRRKNEKDEHGEEAPTPHNSGANGGSAQKPLEYQLIDLMSEPDIDDDVKSSIWSLVQYLTARKAMKSGG